MKNKNKQYHGEYKGYEYLVFPRDGTFNAYVKLPEDHKYAKLTKKTETIDLLPSNPVVPTGYDFYTGYDDMDIDVHGGLTFSYWVKEDDGFQQEFTPGPWIGWDYAHAGDYMRFDDLPNGLQLTSFMGQDCYRWSLKEVCDDAIDVIKQLRKI